jgi:hypothetical protein
MRLRFAAQTLRRFLDHGPAYAATHLRSDIFERFGEVLPTAAAKVQLTILLTKATPPDAPGSFAARPRCPNPHPANNGLRSVPDHQPSFAARLPHLYSSADASLNNGSLFD